MKPGGANGYADTIDKMMPEMREMFGEQMKGHKLSVAAFSSVPQASSLVTIGAWDSLEAEKEFMSHGDALSKIYAKLGDHVDFSKAPPQEPLEADFMDFGCLQHTGKHQSRVLTVTEYQTKPCGTTRQQAQEMMKQDDFLRSMKELELDFGIDFQIFTYPNETSCLAYNIIKDWNAYKHQQSPEGQKQVAAFMKEFAIMEMWTGPPIGHVVFPEAMVWVN